MPRNRKILSHNSTVLITSRTEEGLPFVPNRLINTIIWSILARARSLYQVKICHFVFLANHMHLLLVVDDPEHLPMFMRHVKTETAHAINKLLGRQKKTIWAEGYDSPPILQAEDVFRYINYIYSNTQKANLVDAIEEYPGVSSWEMFINDKHSSEIPKIRRNTIEPMPEGKHSQTIIERTIDTILKENEGHSEFILEPYAFLECFEDTRGLTELRAKKLIVNELRKTETYLREKRVKPILGAKKLIAQDMRASYLPKVHGKRMLCISSNAEQRANYISWFREVAKLAFEAYRSLQKGVQELFPPGVFLPGKHMSANLNPSFMLF